MRTTNFMQKKILMIAVSLGLSTVLSGCAMSQLSEMMPKNPFSKSKQVAKAVPISNQTMLKAAKETVSTASVMPSMMNGCPKLKIWPTGRQLTIYKRGAIGDSKAIRHRGEISKVARECSMGQNRMTVKFGVSGRLLLGPLGKAGKTRLPMLVYVTDPTGKKIMTQKMAVSVNIAPGKPFGYYSDVNRITFKIPTKMPPQKLKLYVSFDGSAPGAG